MWIDTKSFHWVKISLTHFRYFKYKTKLVSEAEQAGLNLRWLHNSEGRFFLWHSHVNSEACNSLQINTVSQESLLFAESWSPKRDFRQRAASLAWLDDCQGVCTIKFLNELPRDKTNKMACAPSEDSDQPGHPPSLIRLGGCPGWSDQSLCCPHEESLGP